MDYAYLYPVVHDLTELDCDDHVPSTLAIPSTASSSCSSSFVSSHCVLPMRTRSMSTEEDDDDEDNCIDSSENSARTSATPTIATPPAIRRMISTDATIPQLDLMPPPKTSARNGRPPVIQRASTAPLTTTTTTATIYEQREQAPANNCTYNSNIDGNQHSFHDLYVLTKELHSTNKSQVWECVHRSSGMRYCVKMICRHNIKVEDEPSILQERAMLSHLQQQPQLQRHVVRIYALFQDHQYFYTVMELMHTTLQDVINSQQLYESQIQVIAKSLVEGVNALHQLKIGHFDLQPKHIFLDQQLKTVKITGFKSAIINPQQQRRSPGIHSSYCTRKCMKDLQYTAPEVRKHKQHKTLDSDMWSVGVVLYQCFAEQFPSLSPDGTGISFQGPDWLYVSRPAKQFLANLFQVDLQVRCTAQEALQQPWLANSQLNTQDDDNDDDSTPPPPPLPTFSTSWSSYSSPQHLPSTNRRPPLFRRRVGKSRSNSDDSWITTSPASSCGSTVTAATAMESPYSNYHTCNSANSSPLHHHHHHSNDSPSIIDNSPKKRGLIAKMMHRRKSTF